MKITITLSILVLGILLLGCVQANQQSSNPSPKVYVTSADDAKIEFIPSSISTTCGTPPANCMFSFQIKNVGDKAFLFTVYEPTSSGKYSHQYPDGIKYYSANPDVMMSGTGGISGIELAPNQVSETITVYAKLLDEATYNNGTYNYIVPVQIWAQSLSFLGESKYSLPVTITWHP